MEEMLSLFTETLGELLEHKGYGTDHEDLSLSHILALLDKFPDFVFGEDIELSFKELFIEKYDIREIGAETEELFMHYWREKTNEIIIKYVPKIQMWLDNFNDLFKFTVKLEIDDTSSFAEGTQNTYYLNPITKNTGTKTTTFNEDTESFETEFEDDNLKVQDYDSADNIGKNKRNNV